MTKAHGFSRDERLRAKRDFDRVFQQGHRGRGQTLVVFYAPNGLTHSRLGIALRRGWRNAVVRNRAKRLIREAFRTRKHQLPRGLDVVVIPALNWRDPAAGATPDRASRGGGRLPTAAALAEELVRLLPRVEGECP